MDVLLVITAGELLAVLITYHINPIALRKAKIVYKFGLSECNRVNNAFI